MGTKLFPDVHDHSPGHTQSHTRTHTRKHTHEHMYTLINIHTQVHTCKHMYMYTQRHSYSHMYADMRSHTFVSHTQHTETCSHTHAPYFAHTAHTQAQECGRGTKCPLGNAGTVNFPFVSPFLAAQLGLDTDTAV